LEHNRDVAEHNGTIMNIIGTQRNYNEHYWNTIGTLLEHYWNTIGTLLEHYWNTIGTPLEHNGTIINTIGTLWKSINGA